MTDVGSSFAALLISIGMFLLIHFGLNAWRDYQRHKRIRVTTKSEHLEQGDQYETVTVPSWRDK